MHASHTFPRLAVSRQTGLIAVAILVAAALAAGAVLVEPPARAGSAADPKDAVRAMAPVGIVGESAVAGDPSVPHASEVFGNSSAAAEEPPATF
ncbi:MAG: hypothetical protein ABI699_09460 [Caldimonas sp.]